MIQFLRGCRFYQSFTVLFAKLWTFDTVLMRSRLRQAQASEDLETAWDTVLIVIIYAQAFWPRIGIPHSFHLPMGNITTP